MTQSPQMVELTTAAELFSNHLQSDFRFTVEDKETSALMKAVVTGLDIARFFGTGVPDHTAFMQSYATTIGTTVCLPLSIRSNPQIKIEVIAHEAQHVLQFLEAKMAFPWLYLTHPADRAQYEADAYATGLAVRAWLSGDDPSASDLEFVLHNLTVGYHLRPDDITYARKAILSHIESIKSGVLMTRSARVTIAWFEANYPHLKGAVR